MNKYKTHQLNIKQQNGAVLMTALIMLVLLTMLGLTSMNNTTMQERMASNTQLLNRAFQAASTGIEIVFADGDAFDTRLTKASDGTAGDAYKDKYNDAIGGSGYTAVTDYNSVFIQNTSPPRGSGWDSTYAYYYFDLSATGCVVAATATTCAGNAIASNTQTQGAYQVGKAP